MHTISFIFVSLTVFVFTSCNHNSRPQEIPKEFKSFISQISDTISYKEILPFHRKEKQNIPVTISQNDALEDIQMMEYLLTTSYSGFEYWQHKGVNFKSYFSNLRDFVNKKDTIISYEFEKELSKILKQIYDGHIALVGTGYNHAYRHKAVYYCDIIVEKTNNGLLKVIDSKFDRVKIGDLFTQKNAEEYLFRTLSPAGKNHYLIGIFSFDIVVSSQLSFNGKTIQVPFHKNSLLYTKYNDEEPLSIRKENNIPIIRMSSFADTGYQYMKRFMALGNELKNEKDIVLDLLYNGGGSSVFPQTFIQNLNGSSEWEISWAVLTSPAIIQYFAKYDLKSMPDISPEFRNTIITYSEKHVKYHRSPVKDWEFGSSFNHNISGSYKGTLVILTNRRILSAGEAMVGYSQSIKNRIMIGENTGGVAQFSDVQQYYLPNSKFVVILPRRFLLIPGLEECVGFLPDYWLDSMEPLKEVLYWLRDPDNYQFKYSSNFAEMLKKNNLAPVLPDDIKIISPSLKVPKLLRAFSGKWLGVSDGILDHMLVVEEINDNLEVNAIYSWGVAYQWNINQPGWQCYKGKFENQKLILADEKNKIKITYKLNSNGTLDATFECPGVFSCATLSRLDKK